MKTLIHKFTTALMAMAVSSICVMAQTRTVEHNLSSFDGIEASDGFRVSISLSDNFGVKLTVDDVLESYVECYVKAGVLHLGLDQKSVPKDLKKQYKGRNSADPTLVAVVYLPTLKSLTLTDDSQFISSSRISSPEFKVSLSGSSEIKDMKYAGKSCEITVGKNARFTNSEVTAEEDVNVACDAKAAVSMVCFARNLNVTGNGSAVLDLKATVEENVKLIPAGGSSISVSGTSASLEVEGKGSSAKVDASLLETDKATLSVSGVSVDVKPTASLELDLGKGADVSFSGNPVINIIKIQNASVTRK